MDTAAFGQLDHLTWTTEFTNEATGTEFQTAEYDRGQWSRVIRYGREVVSPQRNRGEALRRYQRFIRRTSATSEAAECPTCGAPADETGTRIPEHRTGSPCTVDYRAV